MKFDSVFIVLGGGLNENGLLSEYALARVCYCIENTSAADAVIFSSRYSLNTPPKICKKGFPLSEAKVMSDQYCRGGGKSDNIFLENASTDTIGSAVFCRLLFYWAFTNSALTIVTSDFHVERVEKIFDHIFLNIKPLIEGVSINYIATPGPRSQQLRNAREERQSAAFVNEYANIFEFDELLTHLFSHHDNYSRKFASDFRSPVELFY